MSDTYSYHAGAGRLLITVPHAGLEIPADLKDDFTPEGLACRDADRFVDKLYEGIPHARLIARHSRYVLDLNRSAEDEDLYPGQFTTGLFPTVSFAKRPLYKPGKEPGAKEKARRIAEYHTPYHEKIKAVLAEKRRRHGAALLWDGHSIKSLVPSLFEGQLPDFNFGTNDGQSCGLPVEGAFTRVMRDEFPEYSIVFNGRFKGGWTTRHYGKPSENIHAVQLELSQAVYMDEDKGILASAKARGIQKAIGRLLEVYNSLIKEV